MRFGVGGVCGAFWIRFHPSFRITGFQTMMGRKHCKDGSANVNKDGSANLFGMLRRSRELEDDQMKTIAFRVIQRNAFFAHPENILITMVSDGNPVIRKLGWKRIQKARQTPPTPNRNTPPVRAFTVPKINLDARSYHEMISWDVEYAAPPMLRTL